MTELNAKIQDGQRCSICGGNHPGDKMKVIIWNDGQMGQYCEKCLVEMQLLHPKAWGPGKWQIIIHGEKA